MASCVSNQKYMSAQNDIERLKNDSLQLIQAAEVSIEEIEKLNKEKLYYKAQLEAKEAELAQSNMTLNAATQKLVATQQQLNEIAKDLEVFNTDFRIVTVEDGHVKLSMDEAILFKQGSTYINGMGDRFLKELAPIFKRADVEIAVAGHTDPIPVVGQDNNWDLSVDRSIAVIEKLTNDYGVSPEKLMAAGKSKYDPIVPNEKASDMAKNRRVEFIIIPNLEALASAIED
ncbi:hypothetical protein BFP97_15820 [Roseivirga sp. 4D4]|nr:hypothetical protein BFP97_15820 [Roseivirga sp. 4D4]